MEQENIKFNENRDAIEIGQKPIEDFLSDGNQLRSTSRQLVVHLYCLKREYCNVSVQVAAFVDSSWLSGRLKSVGPWKGTEDARKHEKRLVSEDL